MSQISSFYGQLKKRKVIRTSVVYLAVFWVTIEVADLLAGSGMLGERYVRWLLLAGAAGFPLTVILSWFLEAPWRDRRGLAVLGDVVVILAIAAVAVILAWQQFFTSLVRPVVAVVRIEPTDARADTPFLASHLEHRFRMLLATRPEVRVMELESSVHPGLADFSAAGKATALGSDFLLAGTVNQGDNEIRLSVQLFDGKGKRVWSERFEERILDLARLQSRVLNAMWPELPLPETALKEARKLVVDCGYPADEEAIRYLMEASQIEDENPQAGIGILNALISEFPDNAMLLLQRAHLHFLSMDWLAAARKPVAHNLGMNDLQRMAEVCPEHPGRELLKLSQTRQIDLDSGEIDAYLSRHPNATGLMLEASRIYFDRGDEHAGLALAGQAWQLNPLSASIFCHYKSALEMAESGGSETRFAEWESRLPRFSGDLIPECP